MQPVLPSHPQRIIYALHHDDSDYIYIGKSSFGIKRAKQHGGQAHLRRSSHLPVAQWILKRLATSGRAHQIAILEECTTDSELAEAERFHIAYSRSVGMRLLNCTDGGEGTPGLKRGPQSPEHSAKLRAARIGYKHTAESRANMANSRRGKPRSEQFKASFSRARTGKRLTPEWIDHMAIGNSNLPLHIHEFGALAFRAWRKSVGMTAIAAAAILGVKVGCVYAFENRGFKTWQRRQQARSSSENT